MMGVLCVGWLVMGSYTLGWVGCFLRGVGGITRLGFVYVGWVEWLILDSCTSYGCDGSTWFRIN